MDVSQQAVWGGGGPRHEARRLTGWSAGLEEVGVTDVSLRNRPLPSCFAPHTM